MQLIERIIGASLFVGALAATIGGVVELSKNTDELYNFSKKIKTSIKSKKAKSNNNTNKSSELTKSGVCRICNFEGYTEWHHIISRGHAKKTGQKELITNPGNIVELCKSCHDQTTASKSWYLLQKKNR